MAFFDYLLSGLAAVQGATAERDSRQRTRGTSTTNIGPETIPLRDSILTKANTLLNADPDLAGYESSQGSYVNHASDIEKQKIIENLAARGIDPNSPAGINAIDAAESRRFASNVNLHQQIPLLQNDIRTKNLNTANSVFSSMPRSTTVDSTTDIGGNKLGGFITGLSQSLATLHGLGAFGKKSTALSKSTPKFNPE